jgi:eukaryotic-like serine/threonine-protein kinase
MINRKRASVLLLVLLVICSALLGLVQNWAATTVPSWLPPYLRYVWHVFAGLLALTVVLAIVQFKIDKSEDTTGVGRASGPNRHNRAQMLQRVRYDWISGVLEQSLYQAGRIDLEFEHRPGAVSNPMNRGPHASSRSPQPLPRRMGVTDIFDIHASGLLVLGAPGAGKTTLLLELARDLVQRAEADETHPVPMVFHLASWALHRKPLTDWLAEELEKGDYLQRRVAERWIAEDQILPLLDGFDEVPADHREACVERINEFRQQHGLLPIAVCSRIADYESLSARLRLPSAIFVRPLTRPQVQDYLRRGRAPSVALLEALEKDPGLWDLLDTPLMLSIAVLAYGDRPATAEPEAKPEGDARHRLFARYVDTMFRRQAAGSRYSREQTIRWLAWLASSTARLNQGLFHLESLDRNWLPSSVQRRSLTLVYFVVPALAAGSLSVSVLGLMPAVVLGLAFGFSTWIGSSREDPAPVERVQATKPALSLVFVGGITFALSAGSVFGTISGPAAGLVFGVGYGLVALVGIGPGAWVVDWLLGSVKPARQVSLTQEGLLAVLGPGTLAGVVMGLLAALLIGRDAGVVTGLWIGLGCTSVWPYLWLEHEPAVTARIHPNEGTRRSARTALVSGLLFGMIVGVSFGAVKCLAVVWNAGLFEEPGVDLLSRFTLAWSLSSETLAGGALWSGLFFATIAAWWTGAGFCLRHFIVRFFLWRSGCAPWDYVNFLDYARDRLFLRRVGGGYLFAHRLLLDYFASLDPPASPTSPSV